MMNSTTNPYISLLDNLKSHLIANGDNIHNLVYRISMQADLARVQQYGSSRIGLSKKLWDRLEDFKNNHQPLPKETIYHEEVVIASLWKDLEQDVLLKNGTLKHKLHIYERPFFTLYHQNYLQELGHENSKGENNQGRHYLFLAPPNEALHSLWQINLKDGYYTVEKISWK